MIFKKFKSRILITNMIIISVLLLVAMVAVYIVTYNSTHDIIKRELIQARILWQDVNETVKEYNINETGSALESALMEYGEFFRIPWILHISAYAKADENMDLKTFLASNDENNEIYNFAVTNGYIISKEINEFQFNEKNWVVSTIEKGDRYTVVFLDTTSKTDHLNRLVITCIIVYSATLILIFLISLYLTNKSVKPVDVAFAKQKQFISDASHELRTPLATIKANTELVLSKKRKQLGADIKWLEYIKDETNRMTLLTNELLYIAELDDRFKRDYIKYKFDFSREVENHILGMEVVAYEKNVQLDSNIQPEIEIVGHKESLSQVVVILLNNAIKYTDENGSIDIVLGKTRQYISLEVTNTGPGLSPKETEKVFDRFYRTDKARSRAADSYGLGLSIAKTIIEKNNGSILCESSVEGPTTFKVRLKI